MEPNMKKTMENAKTLAGAVHDISHAVAYPMVTKVIKTQVQITERVSELEADMDSAEGNLKNMMNMTDAAIEKINANLELFVKAQSQANAALSRQAHEAVANLITPNDERAAQMENRIHHLESQMSELIRLFGEAAQLD